MLFQSPLLSLLLLLLSGQRPASCAPYIQDDLLLDEDGLVLIPSFDRTSIRLDSFSGSSPPFAPFASIKRQWSTMAEGYREKGDDYLRDLWFVSWKLSSSLALFRLPSGVPTTENEFTALQMQRTMHILREDFQLKLGKYGAGRTGGTNWEDGWIAFG